MASRLRSLTLVLLVLALVLLALPAGRPPAPSPPGNLVVNGDFSQGPAIPGWQVAMGDPRSRAMVHDVFNTPPGDLLLDLAARHGDRVTARQRVAVPGPDLYFTFALRARSTRGDARVRLDLLDGHDRLLATVGWAVVGDLPASTPEALWFDERFGANYLGREVLPVVHLGELLAERLPRVPAGGLAAVAIVLEAADGNHVLFNHVYLGSRPPAIRPGTTGARPPEPEPARPAGDLPAVPPAAATSLALALDPDRAELVLGETLTVRATVTNRGQATLSGVTVTAEEPCGFGLIIRAAGGHARQIALGPLGPGEMATVTWEVRAQRPDAVNLDRPWPARFVAGGAEGVVQVRVRDPGPGVVYYVLTDDLEPMDGAGYAGPATGNRNSWLDPEEFRVQLVDKPAALNRIAEAYGARWSHYLALPAVLAAEWAAAQSPTGRWQEVIAAVEQAVREGAARGHQYSPHLHMDYDPRLPGNVLTYDPLTDGFWANHNEHGWAHQTLREGGFADVASRTGSLFYYLSRLEELTREAGQGQQLAVRTGSFDFGDDPADVRASAEAFARTGLRGGADAEGRLSPDEAAARDLNVYFAAPGDLTRKAPGLAEIGVVQFLPGPGGAPQPEGDSVAAMNAKVDAAFASFSAAGQVRPGVHAVSLFTHAMFMLGDGDWKAAAGGAFDRLDRHLAYVRETYGGRGLIFGTSTELVRAFLDYYTPALVACYGPEREVAPGVYEYSIELLGRHIPLGPPYRHEVTVKYPLYLRDRAVGVEVLRDGEVIAACGAAELPTPYNDVTFIVDRPGRYTLRVRTGG